MSKQYRRINGSLVAKTQAEWDAIDEAAKTLDQKVSDLWSAFNVYAEGEMDQNARVTVTGLPNKLGATEQQLSRAAEVMAWWEAHWLLYGQKKAELEATNSIPEYTFTPCPWSIWDLA